MLGTAAFVQLPMFTQSSAIVNPDILLSVTLAGLGGEPPTRSRRHDAQTALVVLLWVALAALAKPIGGPTALVMAIALLGLGPAGTSWRRRIAVGAGLVATLLVSYVAEAVVASFSVRGTYTTVATIRYSLSYLWQFYLPRLWFMAPGPYCGRTTTCPRGGSGSRRASGASRGSPSPMSQWWYRLAFWSLLAATRHRRVRLRPLTGRAMACASPPRCSSPCSGTCCCCTWPRCCC